MPAIPTRTQEICNLSSLRRHLQTLATLPVTPAPVLSIFLDLNHSPGRLRREFHLWAQAARSTLKPAQKGLFDEAAAALEITLRETWPTKVRSLALYSRAGETPMLHILPFAASLETSFHVAEMPVIFPLVQMKDRFHRFVVAITTEEHARVLEITLGAVSEEILANRPEIRRRIGREWTREHYNQHKRESGKRFLKEQATIINNLMAIRGINHLTLAGSHQAVSGLRSALPKELESRVADALFSTPSGQDYSQVLDEAIAAFIEYEQDESRSTVEMLHERIRRQGLAVVGIHRCRKAMELGAVSELVISESLPIPDREELVRLATTLELPVEVCENDPLLDSHGGVGCLLRYQPQHWG